MAGRKLNLSDEEYQARKKKQGWASQIFRKAMKKGEVSRLDTCELCGRNPRKEKRYDLVAHHWNGYDNPLDIWWICSRCNNILMGPEFHNGSVSKEEAKVVIANFKPVTA